MEQQDWIEGLAEIMEVPSENLTSETILAELPQWTSVAVVGFMAICAEKGKAILAKSLGECKSIGDLIDMVESSESIPIE